METMNIASPDTLKIFVETQVVEGGYSSASEYIRELIRVDQKRKVEEKLEALLLEGLNSGEPIEITESFWDEKRRQLSDRHRQVNGG